MAHSMPDDSANIAPAERPNRPDLSSYAIRTAKEDLAACFRMAARNGFEEGICNHFSAVVPGHDDLFIVNPYGYAFREITASKLLICDFHGNVIDGEGQPEATAFYIHAELHKRLPRAKVAFHTHMPYATALSMTEGEPLIWAGQTALKFYGRTAVDQHYNGLALDHAEGARIAGSVGDADIIFMKHHGVLVLAPTIAEAWDDLYYLERAAVCPPAEGKLGPPRLRRGNHESGCAPPTRVPPASISSRSAASSTGKSPNTGADGGEAATFTYLHLFTIPLPVVPDANPRVPGAERVAVNHGECDRL